MKTLKRFAAILAVMAVAMTAFTACGDESSAPAQSSEQESSVAETSAPEESSEEEVEEEDEEEEEFSLGDVDASMIDTGLYAVGADGEEYVLALFTHDSTKYCAMIVVDEEDNDVVCGAYDAATETDEDGIDWTMLDFDDVYTGNKIEIGFAETDEECYILDQEGNAYEAEYLSADDTIDYFAAAAVAPLVDDEDADAEEDDAESDEEGFSLLDIDASMIENGLYSKDDSAEYVLALFKYDGADYCAMISLGSDNSGDVICGEYAAASETDEDGITWSMLTFDDEYTGKNYEIGFAEADGECYILDQEGTAYEAEYLDADETIEYMAAAVAFAE